MVVLYIKTNKYTGQRQAILISVHKFLTYILFSVEQYRCVV